ELDRVRDNCGVKKLGVDAAQAEAAVSKVAKAMAGDNSKSRVTFHYLVAKELGKLQTIRGDAARLCAGTAGVSTAFGRGTQRLHDFGVEGTHIVGVIESKQSRCVPISTFSSMCSTMAPTGTTEPALARARSSVTRCGSISAAAFLS